MAQLTATVAKPIRKGTAEDGTPLFYEVGEVLDITSMPNREALFNQGYLLAGGSLPALPGSGFAARVPMSMNEEPAFAKDKEPAKPTPKAKPAKKSAAVRETDALTRGQKAAATRQRNAEKARAANTSTS